MNRADLQRDLQEAQERVRRVQEALATEENAIKVGDWVVRKAGAHPMWQQDYRGSLGAVRVSGQGAASEHLIFEGIGGHPGYTWAAYNFRKATPEEIAVATRPAPKWNVGDVVMCGTTPYRIDARNFATARDGWRYGVTVLTPGAKPWSYEGQFESNFSRLETPEERETRERGVAPFSVGDILTLREYSETLREVTQITYDRSEWVVTVIVLRWDRFAAKGHIFSGQDVSKYRLATPAEKHVLTHFTPKVGMLLKRIITDRVWMVMEMGGETCYIRSIDKDWSVTNRDNNDFKRSEWEILPSVTLTGVGE